MWVNKRIAELDEVIATLRADLELANRRAEIRVTEVTAIRERDDVIQKHQLEIDAAGLRAHNEELRRQLAESPYSQLSDILKALVVKLPTLNIQELSVHGKEK